MLNVYFTYARRGNGVVLSRRKYRDVTSACAGRQELTRYPSHNDFANYTLRKMGFLQNSTISNLTVRQCTLLHFIFHHRSSSIPRIDSFRNLNQLKGAKQFRDAVVLRYPFIHPPPHTRVYAKRKIKKLNRIARGRTRHNFIPISFEYGSISPGHDPSTRRWRSKHALPRFTGDLSISRGIPRRYLDAWQARVQPHPLECIFVRGGKTRGRPATVLQLCSWGYLSRLVSTARHRNRVVT